TGGKLVDPVRDQLLPRAALPFDEDARRIALRDLLDDRVDLQHRRALPADEIAREFLAFLLPMVLDLAPQPLSGQLPLEHEQELLAARLPSHAAAGRRIRNRVPWPGALTTSIDPPWRCTMPCATNNPRPVPFGRVV